VKEKPEEQTPMTFIDGDWQIIDSNGEVNAEEP